MPTDTRDITGLLKAWGRGDAAAIDRLTPLIYGELHRLAGRYMRREHPAHTLQATALDRRQRGVHAPRRCEDSRLEGQSAFLCGGGARHAAYPRGCRPRQGLVETRRPREHIDHSTAVNLDHLPATPADVRAQLCALDDALTTLAQVDPRRAQVVELRYFGGLTVEETGQVLKISPQSVMRDWKLARAWLARELSR